MFWAFPLKVQAYNSSTDDWYTKEFETHAEFEQYLDDQFPDEPQYYRLSNTQKWKETGQVYADSVTKPNFEGGRYHSFVRNSVQQKKWRDTEKDRILNGVIYDGLYIPPFYYWYLNFCPIYDDLLKKKKFPDVWDGDLWYMQYCMRAILKGKHIGGIKGRQKGYSYKHMAILYWGYCWFENSVDTVGAYDEKLVKKSWRFLEGYRAHINRNTTWRRGPKEPKMLEWHESQMDENGNPQGLQSVLRGVTFKQKPDNDVGGAQTFFNYEEPGVSPTLLETIEFIRPAVEKGSETTGIIIACGSVGELDDAEGIKDIFYKPRAYNFLPVKNVWDVKRPTDECCIFISEAYNMIGKDKETGKPFMDKDGNSDVAFALKWIEKNTEELKKSNKKSHLKQLGLSQKCTSPEQAFNQRKDPDFPIEQLQAQQELILIKDKDDKWNTRPIKCILYEDAEGNVKWHTRDLPPEHEYPINAEWDDKRGVVTLYEVPTDTPPWLTHFAGVDTVEVDVTTTSESIMTVDIYKRMVKVQYTDEHGKERTRIEGGYIVGTYRGRYNPVDRGNQQAWLLIKLFNAFAYVERSKPNFINFMKRIGKAEKYLAKESDVKIYGDLNNDAAFSKSQYGFIISSQNKMWSILKNYAKEYMYTEFGRVENPETGETLKVITGIDKMDDYWTLEEYIRFVEGKGNYDRIISHSAAVTIGKFYEDTLGIPTIDKRKPKEPEEEVYTPPKPVSMLGGFGSGNMIGSRSRRRHSFL